MFFCLSALWNFCCSCVRSNYRSLLPIIFANDYKVIDIVLFGDIAKDFVRIATDVIIYMLESFGLASGLPAKISFQSQGRSTTFRSALEMLLLLRRGIVNLIS
ncbi:hypothetical protein ACQ4PT_048884 [Festuca glaucescens]